MGHANGVVGVVWREASWGTGFFSKKVTDLWEGRGARRCGQALSGVFRTRGGGPVLDG